MIGLMQCPACKGEPVERRDDWIVCTQCGLRYPIVEGIPRMLVELAERPPSAESVPAVPKATEGGNA